MTWAELHGRSQELAAKAGAAAVAGEKAAAAAAYAQAAELEERALAVLDPSKTRTVGVTAVSAASLWFKARDLSRAEAISASLFARAGLPAFAVDQLRLLLQTIWTQDALANAGRSRGTGQVIVAMKGGDIVTGGAPLELVVEKIQTIQAFLFRTIEYVKDLPYRRRGRPSREVDSYFRSWLFQTVPGSYQFAIAIHEPDQGDLLAGITPDEIAARFLEITKAAAVEDRDALDRQVADADYRLTFLKLTRNLAPTGLTFEHLELRGIADGVVVDLMPESRSLVAARLKAEARPARQGDREVSLVGTLRAVHLDRDWLEVATAGGMVRVTGLEDTLDDLIGPMVNRRIIVRATERKGKLRFIDIETAD